MSEKKEIPVVDLDLYTKGNEVQRAQFVMQLGNAYEQIGFVAVKNHAISESLIDKLYAEVKAFFNLDEITKKKYEIKGLSGQRGYTSFGKEHAKDNPMGDLKEFWHFGQFVEDGDTIGQNYPDNVAVEELPDFLPAGKAAYESFEQTGKILLQAIAEFLGLDKHYFDTKIHNGNSILRPIHYPAITSEPLGAVRAGEHEDINIITLLVGASADGLQVKNKQGEWVAVTALEGQIIVNVGDMLQRLTNNRLRSTTHRVVNPPKEQWESDRYSIPFFLHPRSDMSLNCLENCISQSSPKAYPDITAGDYLIQRLREIGLM